MIFLSHNHKDKALVQQVALRLRDIFGQDKVFYDSWSIQPGDGIIDKMDSGLKDCKFFFFFVSNNSLASNMVKLEWQNALLKATKSECRLVPVKLDDCMMPAIMLQTLYIDLFTHGLEASLRQIVDIVSGHNTFRQGPQEFSNLRATSRKEGDTVVLTVEAIHFMEPVCRFLVCVDNEENDLTVSAGGEGMFNHGFNKGISYGPGNRLMNAHFVGVPQALVPNFPFRINLTPKDGAQLKFLGLLHQKSEQTWKGVPVAPASPPRTVAA